MNDKKILKLAIEKVMKNGWNKNDIQNCTIWFWHQGEHEKGINCLVIDHTYSTPYKKERQGDVYHVQLKEVIFSPDWAKCFWGEERVDGDGFRTICGPKTLWQYHQHKMLDEIQEGRSAIKYLEKFL